MSDDLVYRLRTMAEVGYGTAGEAATEIESLRSRLDTIRSGLNGVLVRNQQDQITDGDAMSEMHELFYQWFQREPPK